DWSIASRREWIVAGSVGGDKGDGGVLEPNGCHDKRVEELVVPEHVWYRVWRATRVHEAACRVAQASRGDECGCGRAGVVEDLRERDDGNPAEGDPRDGGQPLRGRHPGDLRGNRDARASPDDRENDYLPDAV